MRYVVKSSKTVDQATSDLEASVGLRAVAEEAEQATIRMIEQAK